MGSGPDPEGRAALTATKIVFIVIAAAAPLASIVGTVPLMFARANGPGVPGAFLLAGVTLLLFSLGYAAMARHVVNTGAFYTYVAQGLGQGASVVAAFIAVVAYNAQTVGIVGGFGFFTALGTGVPWWAAALGVVAVVGVLGYRTVDVSARVLAVLMVLEIALIALLDVGIVARLGTGAFSLHAFAPGTVFSAGLPVAVLFSFSCFIGFESAALYAEETRDPRRSIPRATYTAVVVIGVFYAFTAWIAVGAVGTAGIAGLRTQSSDDVGQLYFRLMTRFVGGWASGLLGLMVLTSLVAAVLATHNAAARYLFALGREGLLPRSLGRMHLRHRSPHRASVVQTTVNLVIVGVFALAGLDPYIGLASTMIGFGTLGIVGHQALAALSVVAFFRRRGDARWFRTGVAPAVGGAVLVVAVVLVAVDFRVLSNSDAWALDALPALYLVVVAAGVGYAAWLRRHRPAVLDGVARSAFRQAVTGEAATSQGAATSEGRAAGGNP